VIAVRYEIDLDEFFDKFVEAWESRKSTCNKLIIECRRKKSESAIFLITADHRVVAQFPIPEYLLKETDPLREFEYVVRHAKHVPLKEGTSSEPTCLQIKDLAVGMKRVGLRARIVEISEPKMALTRFNDYVMFANAILSDKTSTIKLTLWNGRIETVSVNDVVQIENASVVLFRGELQLKMGRTSTLKVLDKDGLTANSTEEGLKA
jgi:hypothetical protein